MLNLSDVLISHPEFEDFPALVEQIRLEARHARFFRIDIRPAFSDTPDNWESVLESAFSGVIDEADG